MALAASIATPALALEARQAFAFMLATYERTADQCNYADSVRQSMARLDAQNAQGDVAGWAELKARGHAALDNLDGIMPLNMDWTSCSSVGGMLAEWAAIAAVTQAMESVGGTAGLQTPANAQPERPIAVDEDRAAVVNSEDPTTAYAFGLWLVTPLIEVQGGCAMTSPLDPRTKLVALARPGDVLQMGIVTTDAALLNVVGTDLSVVVDTKAVPVGTPQTDHRSVVWFDGRRADQFGIAADFASAEWLEITLNGKKLTRQLKDFAGASAELSDCAERSLPHASADWLLR